MKKLMFVKYSRGFRKYSNIILASTGVAHCRPPRGAAGEPRGSLPLRTQTAEAKNGAHTVIDLSSPRLRNSMRGLRSNDALSRRTNSRASNKIFARNQYRDFFQTTKRELGLITPIPPKLSDPGYPGLQKARKYSI